MPGLEERYISNIDRPKIDRDPSESGLEIEGIVVDFFNDSGYETRFSTKAEDSGKVDIGPRQIIDAVTYLEGKPVMGLQITTAKSKEIRAKKLAEMAQKPFIRLEEMKPQEPAIPRVLIYLDPNKGDNALQILDSAITSLKFDLTQTKNPQEQKAVQQLIQNLTREKAKYIH